MAKKWIGYIGVGSLMCAALGCGILYTRQARLQQTISDKVLRFHVLANSDSEADQNLKLAVRDAVGSFMQEKLTAVENLEECELVVRQSLGEIEEAAAETIAENGYDYDVTAELEHTSFPVKNYGSYTFPAGDYEALRIVIGEGNGHNWWCVLFPVLCTSSASEPNEEFTDAGFTPGQIKVLTETEKPKYVLKFKILEFFGSLGHKNEESKSTEPEDKDSGVIIQK